MKHRRLFPVAVTLAALAALFQGTLVAQQTSSVVMKVDVNGVTRTLTIDLDEATAPKTCANFKKLISEGFYDGLAFHRVIPNYIVQTGDPLSKNDGQRHLWGTGGPGYTIPAELGGKHIRGAVATARLGNPVNPQRESSGSQFYICLGDIPSLDGEYTVFGKISQGIEYGDEIAGVPKDANNNPTGRIEILSAAVVQKAPPAPSLTSTDTAPAAPASAAALPAVSMPKPEDSNSGSLDLADSNTGGSGAGVNMDSNDLPTYRSDGRYDGSGDAKRRSYSSSDVDESTLADSGSSASAALLEAVEENAEELLPQALEAAGVGNDSGSSESLPSEVDDLGGLAEEMSTSAPAQSAPKAPEKKKGPFTPIFEEILVNPDERIFLLKKPSLRRCITARPFRGS